MLRLYVSDGCPACPAAIELLQRLAARFDVDARVVDLGLSLEEQPEAVFAVPTFTLDGQIVSLGTPRWDEIAGLLSAEASESVKGESA